MCLEWNEWGGLHSHGVVWRETRAREVVTMYIHKDDSLRRWTPPQTLVLEDSSDLRMLYDVVV